MTKVLKLLVFLWVLLCPTLSYECRAEVPKVFQILVNISEKGTNEKIPMAVCVLQPLQTAVQTDLNGFATLKDIPEGRYQLEVKYVGYQPYKLAIELKKDLQLNVVLVPQTLALKEVTVTARQNASGQATSSIIGRQAIDHLQASSLADVMQLLPGHIMGNSDLTSASNVQVRTLVNNNTSAFGASVVMDGMPMSNNATLSQGPFSATAFTGTDLRQVSADDIEEVEVVRGIPSAEYGDLTSGLVVVHSKIGVTPWQFKGKVNPGLMNFSLGKGLNLRKAGVLNFNFDYAQAWGDPRQKTRSFHRYTGSVGYGYDITPRWHTQTKLRFLSARDWTGQDPDAIQDGTESKNTNTTFSVNHNGKIDVNRLLARTIGYTIGVTSTWTDNCTTSYVSNSTGLLPILTARETGYHTVPWETRSYQATGITEGQPLNIFLKVNDAFYVKAGHTRQSFKVGAEYKYDVNNGRGYYNGDERLPYRPNSDGRPRAFSDIPGLHQIAAYAEDQLVWNISKVNVLHVTAGLRFTALQPFGDVATTALSPRLNASLSLTKWLEIRGGIGMNSKTPGLNYLYPDAKYADHVAANYMPQDDPAGQLLVYHTQRYDVPYSKGMKNATTTKAEVGIDFKLRSGKKLSILAYSDYTPNGFGPQTEYFTYATSMFTPEHGLVITPGSATTINYADPAVTLIHYMTTGAIGNTNETRNRGIEFDFDCGKITAINTSFFVSGAYSETKTWSTDQNSSSVKASLLPASYSSYGTTPFKIIYPSAVDYTRYRRFVTTLRAVTNIPVLRMVASFTAQAIWHNSTWSYTADKNPIGWIDTDLVRHDLTDDMLNGYIGMDARYYDTAPVGQASVSVQDLLVRVSDNEPTKSPITWNTSFRLTKELGKVGALSLYVNNMLFYEPYLSGNNSNTLTQRNTGTFSFGAELSLNL